MKLVSDFIKDVTEQVKTRVSNSVLICFFFTWVFVNRNVILYWFFSEDSFNSKLKELSQYRFDWATDVLFPLLGVIFYLFLVPMVTVGIQVIKSKYDDYIVNKFEDSQYRKTTLRERKRQRSEQIFKRVIENEVNNRELRKVAAVENKIRLLNDKANAAIEEKRRADEEILAQKSLALQYAETAEKYKEAKSAEHLEHVIHTILSTISELKTSLVEDKITSQIKYVSVGSPLLQNVLAEGMKNITLSINLSNNSGYHSLQDEQFDISLRDCDQLQLDNLSQVFRDINLNYPVRLSVEKYNDFMSFNYNSDALRAFRQSIGEDISSVILKIVKVNEPFLPYIPTKQLLDDVFQKMELAKNKLENLEVEMT